MKSLVVEFPAMPTLRRGYSPEAKRRSCTEASPPERKSIVVVPGRKVRSPAAG